MLETTTTYWIFIRIQTLQDDMRSVVPIDHSNPFSFKTAIGTKIDIEATNHQNDLKKKNKTSNKQVYF